MILNFLTKIIMRKTPPPQPSSGYRRTPPPQSSRDYRRTPPPQPSSSSQTQQRPPGSPGRTFSKSPSMGRTPSPSNWKDPLSYYLDKLSLDKTKKINFCVKCSDKSHTMDNCHIYKEPLKNRCRLCGLFHNTHLCRNSLMQQKQRPIFDKPKN